MVARNIRAHAIPAHAFDCAPLIINASKVADTISIRQGTDYIAMTDDQAQDLFELLLEYGIVEMPQKGNHE